MSNTSKTDLVRLDKMTDTKIDTSDIAELDADFFIRAELREPGKEPITLRVDGGVAKGKT